MGQACELDFVAEGRNAERAAAAFAAATPRVATAPGVVWERTATRVLTMQWVDGCRARARAPGVCTASVQQLLTPTLALATPGG